MAKNMAFAAAVALLAPQALAAQPALGTDSDHCRPSAEGAAALVVVTGFKDRAGRLRIQNYRGLKGEYLESGKYLRRQELPVTAGGDMAVCLALPGPGEYVIVALQDRDENGKLSPFSDGIGFTRNPRLGLSKPPAEKTVAHFGPGVTRVTIVLNYLKGLSVRPIASTQ